MEGKRRRHDEMGEIKKGPWKAEEDEVLIKHVNKYGSRDWSSIRSKGLLQRTGKSCRLRWVNKLRPNLKNGVKFSAEEERTVIDLQAQFGNKWARIATYLPGRTDNDVKNFWSSRQKRLARILKTPAPSSSKLHKCHKQVVHSPAPRDVRSMEAPKFSSSTEEESMTKSQSCSSAYINDSETVRLISLQELMYPNLPNFQEIPLQPELTPCTDPCTEKKPFNEPSQLSFPLIPQLQPEFSLPLENQDFITRLGDPILFDVFGQPSGPEPIMPMCFESERSSQTDGRAENLNAVTPESFIDDFPPMDMFDHIEPLPSPSEW